MNLILFLLLAHVDMPVSSHEQQVWRQETPANIYSRIVEERKIPWKEPDVLPGNSLSERMRE